MQSHCTNIFFPTAIQELLVEMFSDNISEDSSTHQLIQPPERDAMSPFKNYKDDLERALEEDDNTSTTSFI